MGKDTNPILYQIQNQLPKICQLDDKIDLTIIASF